MQASARARRNRAGGVNKTRSGGYIRRWRACTEKDKCGFYYDLAANRGLKTDQAMRAVDLVQKISYPQHPPMPDAKAPAPMPRRI